MLMLFKDKATHCFTFLLLVLEVSLPISAEMCITHRLQCTPRYLGFSKFLPVIVGFSSAVTSNLL